ncbi:MAG TPA: CDP-2,3-bis-(O-geranylgeranyl)-sn-glycerol synthase [Candidatus Deferrimicrobium sp.]|nr:CDP-2,3-bis-(O-geranylgeranyl)-sn-glycerol synthase [Candidatus Deferrimicrobium sp.]
MEEKQPVPERKVDPRGIKLAYSFCIIFGIGLIFFLILPPLLGFWTWWDVILIFALSLLFIAPAYATNASMVIFGRNGTPIDGGRTFIDGRRIFGDGKTWQGLGGGVLTGTIVGIVLVILSRFFIWDFVQNQAGLFPMALADMNYLEAFFSPPIILGILRVFLVALGAPLGDLIGSFFKRRLNLERGAPAPIIDQLDFLLGSIFLAWIVFPLRWMYIVFALLITLLLHVLANTLGFKLGYTRVPW